MDKLYSLLDKYNLADEDDLTLIEEEIWNKFGAEKCIMVLDMSGFTQTVAEKGIVHYLSMIRKMQLATEPIIAQYKGNIVKYEADNIFAVFDSVKKCIDASVAVNMAMNAMNILTDERSDIEVGIGIGFGKILLIAESDFFGDQVNITSKLGEDFAKGGEILLSEAAFTKLDAKDDYEFQENVYSVSALMIKGMKLMYNSK